MATPPFILSLHRPFHQSLKATKWVCEFLNSKKRRIKNSETNIEFYLFLLNSLHKEYTKSHAYQIKEYGGIPSKEAIIAVYNYLLQLPKIKKIEVINTAVKAIRNKQIERDVYNTYKAASYFVNLAKEKFNLIDKSNQITDNGKSLLLIRGGFFKYTRAEKIFFFRQILEADFLLFQSLCYFLKLAEKYDLKDYISLQFNFLDEYYDIRHFNFTNSSLGNYNTVRSYWINTLGVLNKYKNIKPIYYKVITNDERFKKWNEELVEKVADFEKKNFRTIRSLANNILKLEKAYKSNIKKNRGDLGFVNLYDIKEHYKISHNNFEDLLNKYYEQEKGKKHIFFSNIVSSIDRRKRFNVRGIPVLKIKIK